MGNFDSSRKRLCVARRIYPAVLTATAVSLCASSAAAQTNAGFQGGGTPWWDVVPRLPLGQAVEEGVDFVTSEYGSVFSAVADGIDGLYGALEDALVSLPPPVVALVLVATIWKLAGRGAGIFCIAAILLIIGVELWPQTMSTFALIGTAVIIALALGIPIGIVAARSSMVEAAITPLLDFMQTMPPFVYLIPAVIMFGIGPVPAILATVFYAVPVPIRLTNVGIRQVDRRIVEAGEAFGCSSHQLLLKIKLPLALPMIVAGVNQTIMYSLGMVIVASMIGAGGLGAEILRGITRLQLGVGFEAGLAVVMVAVILDRLGRGVALALGGQRLAANRES